MWNSSIILLNLESMSQYKAIGVTTKASIMAKSTLKNNQMESVDSLIQNTAAYMRDNSKTETLLVGTDGFAMMELSGRSLGERTENSMGMACSTNQANYGETAAGSKDFSKTVNSKKMEKFHTIRMT